MTSEAGKKAAHTPGPWTALPEELGVPYIRIRGTRLGGRYKVANVITPAYEGVYPREADETRANARLIAAAPRLLAACKAAEKWLEGWASAEPYLREIRAAIDIASAEPAPDLERAVAQRRQG